MKIPHHRVCSTLEFSEASFGPTNSKNFGIFDSSVQLKPSYVTNKDLNINPTPINESPIISKPQETNVNQNKKVSPSFGGGKSFVFGPPEANSNIETSSRNPSSNSNPNPAQTQTLNTREIANNLILDSLPTSKSNGERSKGKKIEFIKKPVLSPKPSQDITNKSIDKDPKKSMDRAIAVTRGEGNTKKTSFQGT